MIHKTLRKFEKSHSIVKTNYCTILLLIQRSKVKKKSFSNWLYNFFIKDTPSSETGIFSVQLVKKCNKWNCWPWWSRNAFSVEGLWLALDACKLIWWWVEKYKEQTTNVNQQEQYYFEIWNCAGTKVKKAKMKHCTTF